jgi:hypothetical protein
MKLIDALRDLPGIAIFRIDVTNVDDPADWNADAVDSPVLHKQEGFFLVRAKIVRPDASVQDCYMDISLPERINDSTYFFDGKSLAVKNTHKCEGDVICAVPIDCFGNYELFYSKINPEVGLQILRSGLSMSQSKHYIAEDSGYILRDEGRFIEAAAMFQIAANEGPSSYFLYGELASCYSAIGDSGKAKIYQELFDRADKGKTQSIAKWVRRRAKAESKDVIVPRSHHYAVAPRPPFWLRLSILQGNLLQLAGLAVGAWIMYLGGQAVSAPILRVALMILGWLVVYLCCHSLAHWLVGRLAGIHFREYGVRGTDHPQQLSPIMRAVLSRLPMFTAITEKDSMRKASPIARALMFAAGETSTIVCTLLAGLYAWESNIPGGLVFLIAAVLMSITGVVSTSQMARGDYAKARRALRGD